MPIYIPLLSILHDAFIFVLSLAKLEDEDIHENVTAAPGRCQTAWGSCSVKELVEANDSQCKVRRRRWGLREAEGAQGSARERWAVRTGSAHCWCL